MEEIENDKAKKIFREGVYLGVLSFLGTFFVILVLYKIYHFAPFGTRSMACMDANIQYLDFFAYLKDVILGKNGIDYTFSKGLGGCNIANYSYYLSSPWNIFVVFFDKSKLHIFFDLLIAGKLSCAAVTFSIFLNKRFVFKHKISFYQGMFLCLLSISYALGQYSIAQSSNIMWLDGVYMLPLVLLGVYRVVNQRSGTQLAVCVALTILFNWYSGAINCLFSGIWFLFELFLSWENQNERSIIKCIKDGLRNVFHYGISLLAGIMASAILFFPTIMNLRGAGRATPAMDLLKDFSFNGSVITVVGRYVVGGRSSLGAVSLFCGSLALIGCLCFFCSKGISITKKALFLTLFCVMLLIFYWNPLYNLFSLLKSVESYWYRYSYVGIFVIVFISACYYLQYFTTSNIHMLPLAVGVGFTALLTWGNYTYNWMESKVLVTDIVLLLTVSVIVTCANYCNKKAFCLQIISGILVIMVSVGEIGYSVKIIMNDYGRSDVDAYETYVSCAEQQFAGLYNLCDLPYRISQTATRTSGDTPMAKTANYNEPLAFHVWSLTSYTSAPDDIQLRFLNSMGYRANGGCMSVVNTSLIGIDALLGVKYVLSNYPIKGLVEEQSQLAANGKKVYENPYCLPFSFTYMRSDINGGFGENLFENQNMLYSQLMGERVQLYVPVPFSVIHNGDEIQPRIYEVQIPEGNYVLYGNLLYHGSLDAVLTLNGEYQTSCGSWLAPSVFYVPVLEEKEKITVEVMSQKLDNIRSGEEQFYVLDLTLLESISKQINNQKADDILYQNGHIKIKATGKKDQLLYTSVPYGEGWHIALNGEDVVPELFGDCLYVIPMVEGENIVEMNYYLPGAAEGKIASIIGGVMVILLFILERKYMQGRRKEIIDNLF